MLYTGQVPARAAARAARRRGRSIARRTNACTRPLLLPGRCSAHLGASGDFAWAYVIAHEVGHHVQNAARARAREVRRLEREQPTTRTSCWSGRSSRPIAMPCPGTDGVPGRGPRARGRRRGAGAASAVGDDRLQREATGRVNPDSFTHGTSEQRQKWFDRGRESGEPPSATPSARTSPEGPARAILARSCRGRISRSPAGSTTPSGVLTWMLWSNSSRTTSSSTSRRTLFRIFQTKGEVSTT